MQLLLIVPYAIIILGIGLAYGRLIPPMVGWGITALGVLSGAVGGVSAAIFYELDMLSILVAITPVMVAIPMVINDLRYPRINDVSTRWDIPLEFVSALSADSNLGRDLAFPEKNGPIIRQSYPDVVPVLLSVPIEQVFENVVSLAKKQPGWDVTSEDEVSCRVEAEATTSFYRFVDDVVIEISDQDGESRVDMRSRSRDGLVDAGANAKRICSFLGKVKNAPNGLEVSVKTLLKR